MCTLDVHAYLRAFVCVSTLPCKVVRGWRPVLALRLEAPEHGHLPESNPGAASSGASAGGSEILGLAFSVRVGAVFVWRL